MGSTGVAYSFWDGSDLKEIILSFSNGKFENIKMLLKSFIKCEKILIEDENSGNETYQVVNNDIQGKRWMWWDLVKEDEGCTASWRIWSGNTKMVTK